MKRAILLMLLLGCGGEASDPEPSEPGASAPQTPTANTVQTTPVLGEGTWANARGYYARWRCVEGEVPLNEEFTAEVWLSRDEAGRQPIEHAQVVIDCRMPAHRHGMLSDVELVHQGEGRYLAEGMLCHMRGHWELYVDLTRGRMTERVQWDLQLD